MYVIGGCNPEYEGWLQINAMKIKPTLHLKVTPNSDYLRKLVTDYVNGYMLPAGQKYRLYWASVSKLSLDQVYQALKMCVIPRYDHSRWFNTDVWTIRQILRDNDDLKANYRRLKPIDLAKYLDNKYQNELSNLLIHSHDAKEQRFKRDFYNEWHLSKIDSESIKRVIKMFSAFLLLRNLVNTVPKGCRKMFRKLVPLNMDDLGYDQRLLDYKFHLNKMIHIKHQINMLLGKPFGTAEFTNQYLKSHVKFLKIFNPKLLKQNFNL